MPNNASRDHYQGLLIPDPRVTLDPVATTATGTGAYWGQPVPDEDSTSRLQLRTLHKDVVDGTDPEDSVATILTRRGGAPTGRLIGGEGATFVWRRGDDTASTHVGWDPPYLPTASESLGVETSAPVRYGMPAVAVHPVSGTAMIAFRKYESASTSIQVRTRGLDATAWGAASTAVFRDGDVLTDSWPVPVGMPDGSWLLFYVRRGSFDNADYYQLVTLRSLDDGASWSTVSESGFPTDILASVNTPIGLAVAERAGEMLLIIDLERSSPTLNKEVVWQYASSDGGCSWTRVAAFLDDNTSRGSRFASIATTEAGFHVVVTSAVGLAIYHTLLGSAFESIVSAPRTLINQYVDGTVTTGVTSVDEMGLALASTEEGTLWLYLDYGYENAGVGLQGVLVSRDYGATWAAPSLDGRTKLHKMGTVAGLSRLTAAWQGSRMIVGYTGRASGPLAVASGVNASIGCLYMGGYTQVEQPADDAYKGSNAYRVSWTAAKDAWGYLALDVPSPTEWTGSGVAVTESITSDGWYRMTRGSGGAYQLFSAVPTGTLSMGRVTFRTPSSLSGAASGALETIRIDSTFDVGAEVYGFRLSANATTLYLSKRTGTTSHTVITSVAVDVASGVEVLWATDVQGQVRVFYRAGLTNPVRRWTQLVEDAQLDDISGTVSAPSFAWGVSLDSGDTADFREILHLTDAEDAITALYEAVNPSTFAGRPYTSASRGAYLEDGITLVASGGPTYPGVNESWTVSIAYRYGLEGMGTDDPKHVTKFPWVEGEDVELVYNIGDGLGDSFMGADLIGIAFVGSNVGRVEIEGYDVDDADWYLLGSADFGVVLGDWRSTGASIRPLTNDATGTVVRMGEFDGAVWHPDYAAEDPGRIITGSYEGKWSASSKKAVLHLDSTPGNATGTDGRIVPRTAVALVSLQDNAYSKFRIRIPDDYVPPDETWEIGRILIGPVVVHGDAQAWGRTVETRPNVEVFTSKDGSRRTTRWGPPRRVVEFSWSDGIDTTNGSGTEDPDIHYLEDNGDPVALSNTTPWQIEGTVAMLDGALGTVVYLPRIDRLPEEEESVVLSRRHEAVYGRVTSPVRLETVQGEEGETEVIRIASITIEEEV